MRTIRRMQAPRGGTISGRISLYHCRRALTTLAIPALLLRPGWCITPLRPCGGDQVVQNCPRELRGAFMVRRWRLLILSTLIGGVILLGIGYSQDWFRSVGAIGV